MIIKKQISNYPNLPGVTRNVIVFGHTLNTRSGQESLLFDFKVECINSLGQDITPLLNNNMRPWVINNQYQVHVRDWDTLEPEINPYFEPNYPLVDGLNEIYSEIPDNLEEQHITMTAFDYFYQELHINQGKSIEEILEKYIPFNDSVHKMYDPIY